MAGTSIAIGLLRLGPGEFEVSEALAAVAVFESLVSGVFGRVAPGVQITRQGSKGQACPVGVEPCKPQPKIQLQNNKGRRKK